ncbi:MAG: glutamate--tRNA ligase [Desulfovibrionales bacterium]
MSTIVTRFAPSPTGYLHVGGARTAVFNWLLARHENGKFILRIEDTDQERSTPEATQAILDGMTWLGLDWDELHYQSERTDLHNEHIDRMLESGTAYWCECTSEEVQAMRDKAMAEKRKPKYDLTCREKNLGPGPGRVVRLKAPLTGSTRFTDLIKGVIAVSNEELDDLVLRRADGSPTYNLAVVVDDVTMGVTRIIRGDDHVNNTPRQILIYHALGLTPPAFGHVPMILGPDKKKLSKRHGATSITEYRTMGFLSDAMVNYLLRLGWSHGDQEIFSRQEMIDLFSTENLGSSASVFDMDKLLWLNAQHIKESAPKELAALLLEQLEMLGLPTAPLEYLHQIIPLLQPRARTMREMAEMADFFVLEDEKIAIDPKAGEKFLTEETKGYLQEIAQGLSGLPDFDRGTLERYFGEWLEDKGIKFKIVAQPIRVALTGRTASPGLFETMEVLGREKTITRLERAAT